MRAGHPIASQADTVPSITTLMQTYHVARNTARKALLLLADEGCVRIVPGWGTFVIPRDDTPDA